MNSSPLLTEPYSLDFVVNCGMSFHKTFKYWLHAFNYGSYKASNVRNDFYSMYNMGSEL